MYAFFENRLINENLKAWQSTYSGLSYMAHWHREIEINYIRQGSAQINMNNNIYELNAGDIFICKPGYMHSLYGSEDSLITVFLVNPDIIGKLNSSCKYLKNHIISDNINEELREIIERLFSKIRKELLEKEEFYEMSVKSLFTELFILFLRNFSDENTVIDEINFETLTTLQTLLDYIYDNYNKNISLEEAAQRVHFSPSHFSKVFKKFTNINYLKYCHSIKIDKAIELLSTSKSSIVNIAKEVGFQNIRTFNRVFLQITGVTPTEYLNSGKQYKRQISKRLNPKLALTSFICEYI